MMSFLGFKVRVGSLNSTWHVCVTCSLRFTSGVTPAELLVASVAAELDLFHLPASRHGWGSRPGPILPQRNALLTELCRLGYIPLS